ncbi:MAG: hypothetical protein V7744_20530 [Pseudomonadales bacterium]
MIIQRTLLLCALLFTSLAFSADISGIWKHAQNPAWIEIQLEEGSGTVARNDKFPDRVGRKILKDLQADQSKQGLWHGLIYAEKLGEYKDVEVSLPEADRMLIKGKVGFISRTVEWVRLEKIPAREKDQVNQAGHQTAHTEKVIQRLLLL